MVARSGNRQAKTTEFNCLCRSATVDSTFHIWTMLVMACALEALMILLSFPKPSTNNVDLKWTQNGFWSHVLGQEC